MHHFQGASDVIKPFDRTTLVARIQQGELDGRLTLISEITLHIAGDWRRYRFPLPDDPGAINQ